MTCEGTLVKRGGRDRDEVGPDSPATFRHPATASRVSTFGRNNRDCLSQKGGLSLCYLLPQLESLLGR